MGVMGVNSGVLKLKKIRRSITKAYKNIYISKILKTPWNISSLGKTKDFKKSNVNPN